MKRITIFSTALLITYVFTFYTNEVYGQTTTKKTATEQSVTKKYTCSMHPEVNLDKPGKCPKCGMALVEKTDIRKGGMHNMQDSTIMKCDTTKMKKCC